MFNASQLYAQLTKHKNDIPATDNKTNIVNESRQIQLHESGEASLIPDRIRCIITCANVKVCVYILQGLLSTLCLFVIETIYMH